MRATQKETDNQGGILLNATANDLLFKSGYALCNSGQLLCGRAELAVSDTAVRNSILRKREIPGVERGKKEGN